MGQEFAIVFDVAIVAVAAGFLFAGWKNGFAKVIIGMVSVIAAFACAMIFSRPIAEAVYENFIEETVTEQIDGAIDEGLRSMRLGGIPDMDFDKVEIAGTPVTEITPDYAGTGKAVFDLSKVDLSKTGLDAEDLRAVGLDEDIDLTSVNAKTADFSMDDIEKYGLGKLVAAQAVAVRLVRREDFKGFNDIADTVGKYVPIISGVSSSDTMGVGAARALALTMIETKDSIRGAVIDGMIKPNCLIIIRTAAFILIFSIVTIALGVVANLTKLLNKVPVIGKANALAGALAGLCEGLVAVCVICLATRFIVSLCGGNAILFNQTAIDSTFIFKRVYEVDFLNFLT
ncbi:MAG: CvpA family protein [Lachnospiraceae bacterium]|nr:CvpA family protein [Ruminococcus sp.]MCM1275061.1 CvpA family protein [Lachnospiraceae bacterium]